MAFTVQGVLDNVPYSVTVDPTGTANPDEFDPTVIGITSGSSPVITLLRLRDGEKFSVTPTGPFYVLDPTDEVSVFAALSTFTEVTATSGEGVPEVVPPLIDGVVY